jgi:FkbM family methyltransferase
MGVRLRRLLLLTAAVGLFAIPAAAAEPRSTAGENPVADVDAKGDALLEEIAGYGFDPWRMQRTLIRHFFQDRRGGFFLDVGAAHYRKESTTFFLEDRFGWSGIAIDALAFWGPDYETHRPKTRFFSYIVTDHAGAEEPFFHLKGDIGSTASRDRAERIHEKFETKTYDEILVPTITLDTLLDREGVTKIDFLSMDIEGGEKAALAAFDIERFRPELVGIEVLPESRAAIEKYFEQHGYRRIETYRKYDPRNWYYTCRDWKRCAATPRPGRPLE